MAEPLLVRFSDPTPRASSASISSRREFLQRTVASALAASVGGAQPVYAVLYPHKRRRHRHHGRHLPRELFARADDRDAPYVFGGEVLDLSPARITILDDGQIRQVSVTSRSALWRDGDTTIDRLVRGDRLLVRTNPRHELEHGWSNLVRVRGTVVGRASGTSFLVQPGTSVGQGANARSGCAPPQPDPCDPIPIGPANPVPVEVQTDDATVFVDAFDADIVTTAPSYLMGSPVDIVGFDGGSTIHAFSFTYVLPGTEGEATPSQDDITEEIGDSSGLVKELSKGYSHCVYAYAGFATWFDCNGARCGNCSSGNSGQLAWPTLDSSSCGCGSFTCCRNSCRKQVRLACSSKVTVIDKCHHRAKNFKVVDCGPNQRDCSGDVLCDHRCRLCGDRGRTPIVDLTKASFARFFDPQKRGCFPCLTKIYIHGPGCG